MTEIFIYFNILLNLNGKNRGVTQEIREERKNLLSRR
jgi:hypothetical protein